MLISCKLNVLHEVIYRVFAMLNFVPKAITHSCSNSKITLCVCVIKLYEFSGWWSVPNKHAWNFCNWRCCSISIEGTSLSNKAALTLFSFYFPPFLFFGILTHVLTEQMYDRIARVEHVDHARRSAQHCVKALLSAQTHTYIQLSIMT